MEYGDTSSNGLLDIRRHTWHAGMLHAVDLERDLASCLPALLALDATVGTLRSEAARQLGLCAGISVSVGGGDNVMAANGTWAMTSMRSVRAGGTWSTFANRAHICRATRGVQSTLNIDGQEVQQKGYITDELTDYSMEWLEHGRDKSKPFFLYLSHKAVPPADMDEAQYSGLRIDPPASKASTPENNRGKPR